MKIINQIPRNSNLNCEASVPVADVFLHVADRLPVVGPAGADERHLLEQGLGLGDFIEERVVDRLLLLIPDIQ